MNTKIRNPKMRTAAVIIIGNEILSGRTQDRNINVIARGFFAYGIDLTEVRIVADVQIAIIKAVRELRQCHDYVLTSGGIGPTHDDITAESLAAAFDLEYATHPEADQRLREFYSSKGLDYNPARQRMAKMPMPSELIDNAVSIAPGFRVKNVYALPGVPHIMERMFGDLLASGRLKAGKQWHSRSLIIEAPESEIAPLIASYEKDTAGLQLGSYPREIAPMQYQVTLILRHHDATIVNSTAQDLASVIKKAGFAVNANLDDSFLYR